MERVPRVTDSNARGVGIQVPVDLEMYTRYGCVGVQCGGRPAAVVKCMLSCHDCAVVFMAWPKVVMTMLLLCSRYTR